jgi:tetratricopeptide (TPR) repeat protein
MNFARWRHYGRGWLLHFIGRESQAYGEFVEAFRHDPNDLYSARHLAAIAANRKRYDVAERWFEKALTLAPQDASNWFNLAFVRERAGLAAEALAAFAEAVRYDPKLDRAWYGMGLAHARLGQHGEAAAALERAVELQPLNGEGWYQLGMAYYHSSLPDKLRQVVIHLAGFEPKRARQLVKDAGRADLLLLIPKLPF